VLKSAYRGRRVDKEELVSEFQKKQKYEMMKKEGARYTLISHLVSRWQNLCFYAEIKTSQVT
jgi:hypothetical protein